MYNSYMHKIFIFLISITFLYSESLYYEYNQKVTLTPIIKNKSISINTDESIKYYKKSNGRIVGVKNTLLAKCKPNKNCKGILNSVDSIRYELISNNTYLITVNKNENIFAISQMLYEKNLFLYVHPNFYKEKHLR